MQKNNGLHVRRYFDAEGRDDVLKDPQPRNYMVEFDVRCKMSEDCAIRFLSLLQAMQDNGHEGTSREIIVCVDGDGSGYLEFEHHSSLEVKPPPPVPGMWHEGKEDEDAVVLIPNDDDHPYFPPKGVRPPVPNKIDV
mgnify:CR=1 FL=1